MKFEKAKSRITLYGDNMALAAIAVTSNRH